jgi:acyl-CoA synthetase (AMP-forming)/AMP-acid ligase II
MSKNLGDLIDLNKNLNQIAIICEDQKITYRALNILANSVAYSLSKKDIKKGDRVAIISLNSIDYVILYLGILKLGAVAVLIHANSPQSQIDYILKDTNCKLILKDISDLDIPIGIEFLFNTPIEENDPALILYTSGSTSLPKGVIHSHKRKTILNMKSKNFNNKIIITASPLSHNQALNNLELSLIGHSTIILLPKFNAQKFIECIKKYHVNKISAVPTMLSMILKEKNINSKDFDTVKDISLSGSELTLNLYNNIKLFFKNATIYNKYGSTEAGGGLFSGHPTLPTPPLSVGYPIASMQYRIVEGILQVKSPSMMLEYKNKENNRLTNDGYFITNDLFKIDQQGFYYYMGRADDMFINGGNNVYPKQIESVLETHPHIKEAVVIGLEDEIKGTKPYAFIVTTNNVNENELKEFILKQLPVTHCPKKIWVRDSFPLTLLNKIDKKKLKEIARQNI